MTSGPNYWDVIGQFMAFQVPFLLAYTIGFVFVFLRRRRAPKAAALALAAFTLMFLSLFLASALQGYLIAEFQNASITWIQQLLSVVGWGRTICDLIALGLLATAVFTGRPRAAQADAD